jgi:hypothetical protein
MSLQDELLTGSLSAEIAPHLASADDVAISAILNRKDIPVYSTVTWAQFSEWAAQTGVRADIEDWKTHASRGVRALAWTLSDGLIRGAGSIDFGSQAQVALLNGLVGAGLLSATDKDTLLVLATVYISKAEQLGISATGLDIRRAIWTDNGTRII